MFMPSPASVNYTAPLSPDTRAAGVSSNKDEEMLSKCANPECSDRFLYLRGGRLVPISATAGAGATQQQELFWLCSKCSNAFDLTITNGRLEARRRPRADRAGPSRA